VDFVLGLNNYARAELKKKFLGILFWYSGDKHSGIVAMERCGKNAQFVGFAAAMVLQDIYVREGMFDTAEEGTGRLLALYPDCRFAMWSLAKLHDALKHYDLAAQTYGRLADAYEKIPLAFRSAGATRYFQAQRCYAAGDMEGAAMACMRLLDLCKNIPCEECGEGEALLKKITGGK
jgi:tetratricopeptide (TPR) repeat protein